MLSIANNWREGDRWRLELIVGEGLVALTCVGIELSLDDI
jgi:hypothetical protein